LQNARTYKLLSKWECKEEAAQQVSACD